MNQSVTQILAVWGAIVSTIALLWQIYQWRSANPRIAVKAFVTDGPSSDFEDAVVFELRNRGRYPTTVEAITFVTFDSWWSRLLGYPNQVENIWVGPQSKMILPAALTPGEAWKGQCPLDLGDRSRGSGPSRRERFNQGRLLYRIRCAHTDRLIKGRVLPEEPMRS